jgi:hypothetical protein
MNTSSNAVGGAETATQQLQIEVGHKNGIGHMLEQHFRQMQPSGTSVEFAPELLQFNLQLLGRCLSASDRI